MGAVKKLKDVEDKCTPIVTNADLSNANFTDRNKSWNGTPLDPNATAIPCGLIAKSYFNDTYKLYQAESKE